MVRLRRLTLKDFISHRHTTICFDDSAYVIIGENASGKTSILRGIFFSLFGKDFTVDKLEKLIRRNTSSMLTELTFLHRGTEFTVKRRYFLSRRKAEAELFKEGSLYASGVRDVSRVISEELGLEPNIFRNTIYVPQGEIMALLSMQRKERRQILNKFLGLDEMGRKHEETKLFLSKLKLLRNHLKEQEQMVKEMKAELASTTKEVAQTRERLQVLKASIRSEEALLDSLESAYKVALEKKERFVALKKQLSHLQHELNVAEQELKEAETAVENTKKMQKELSELSKETSYLPLIEELIKNKKDIVSLEKELKEVERRLAEFCALKNEIPQVQRQLKLVLKEIELAQSDLNNAEAEFQALKEREKLYEVTLSSMKEYESQVVKLTQEVSILPSEKSLKDRQERVEKMEKHLESMNTTLAQLLTRLKDQEERKKMLEASEGGRCPVCGAPLSQEHRERLLAKAISSAKEVAEKIKELRHGILSLSTTLDGERKLLTTEQRACEKRAYIESELKKLKEKLSFLKEKLKNLKFEPALLQDSQGKLQRSRNRFLELKEKKKLLEGKLIELNRRFNVLAQEGLKERRDNLALRLKELKQATKALADRLSGSVPKVWQSLEELELKFNQLKRLKERQLRIETEVKKLPEYLESVRRRNEKLNRLKKDIAQLKETLSGLDFEVENFKKLENSLTFQRKKVERLKSEVSKLEGIVDTLEKRRVNIQTKLKEKEKALSLVPVVDDVIGVVDAVTDTLHPERGFLREVRDNLLPVISGYCEEFFEEFGFALGGLELSEDLTVSFSSRSSASHILELSGGQQVAFALSLRFAMARYFSHTFDLLILDEPTVHLDSLRKQALVDLLLALKVKIPQMIVVTHDPELEAVGDKVIRVKNTGAFSEVFEDASFAV